MTIREVIDKRIDMSDHPEACNCITWKSEEHGKATCGPCIHGEHSQCTAHLHGVDTDTCPRA